MLGSCTARGSYFGLQRSKGHDCLFWVEEGGGGKGGHDRWNGSGFPGMSAVGVIPCELLSGFGPIGSSPILSFVTAITRTDGTAGRRTNNHRRMWDEQEIPSRI